MILKQAAIPPDHVTEPGKLVRQSDAERIIEMLERGETAVFIDMEGGRTPLVKERADADQ